MSTNVVPESSARDQVNVRLRRVLAAHLDPEGGSAYWLDRQRKLGFDVLETVQGVDDLHRLGWTDPRELANRPLLDFIPRCHHRFRSQWLLGQTGGTTGRPAWSAYSAEEFSEAFVRPFELAADHVGFPRGAVWLYVGPSGPHIIGKAAMHLAHVVDSAEPFTVDFDPRWAKKLAEGSFAARRYLDHVVEQAMAVLEGQPVGVLFTTPRILEPMAKRMTRQQRDRIRGVHYGGMALSSETLRRFQREDFPNAVHLSGYGNTLFGCCLELGIPVDRPLDYFPLGDRLLFTVVETVERPEPPAYPVQPREAAGRVVFTRLDETMLLINVLERDQAVLVPPPTGSPRGFVLPGVRNPHPIEQDTRGTTAGLY